MRNSSVDRKFLFPRSGLDTLIERRLQVKFRATQLASRQSRPICLLRTVHTPRRACRISGIWRIGMKHTITILFLLVFIAVSDMTAQSLYSERYTQSISRALLCNRAVSNPAEQQVGDRREAQLKANEFWSRTEKFIDLWTTLARDDNKKGTFHEKKSKQVYKAFHDL